MDGPGHWLSLKVMRVSRPAIANAWQPFYSSSPSLSAHSTASIVSLQGKSPLSGHPKTLRDLTHATELLTLPSSFGAIQLGETFSSCLCVNNEANVDIEAVTLKVDIQTASTKVQLAEFGGLDHVLTAGDTLENIVQHEIKELGQHVLACTVTYRLPPHARHAPGPAEDIGDPTLQTFRKFYKFAVTNPLSVKTKVHAPRSPTALLSATEREKIFLEVHIQNLTQEPMWFERVGLEAVEGWTIEDENVVGTGPVKESIFSEKTALMQPQDMRQYVYTMMPISIPSFPAVHTPGSIIPLGRLDISWRSSFGEPGRLLTSMLSRRIPLLPPIQAASAIPSYLQRNTAAPSGVPPRPSSPQHAPSPPGTPAIRPGSPFRSRTGTPSVSARPQSPGPVPAASSQVVLSTPARPPDLEVDLVVRHIPRESITIQKPFTITCELSVSASVPSASSHGRSIHRVVSLVVQHVQPRRIHSAPISSPEGMVASSDTLRHRLPLGLSSASPTATPWRGNFTDEKPLVTSPENHSAGSGGAADRLTGEIGWSVDEALHTMLLPPPFTDKPEDKRLEHSKGIVFLGPSTIFLENMRLSGPTDDGEQGDKQGDGHDATLRGEAAQGFDLSYIPLVAGFASIGGLRIILVDDQLVDRDQTLLKDVREGISNGDTSVKNNIRILKEWDVIGEIWVKD